MGNDTVWIQVLTQSVYDHSMRFREITKSAVKHSLHIAWLLIISEEIMKNTVKVKSLGPILDEK